MRWRRIRRAAALYALGIAAAALISGGLVGSTAALFTAETQNANSTFAGGWVDPPGAITATPSGYTVGLAWTPGTHGPVTGQTLYGVDNGNNSNCIGATYTLIGSMVATAGTYTDTSRGTAANNGDWFCYQLASTSATSWTASAKQSLQLGLVASSIAWTNAAGGSGTLTNNDQLTITFNQKTNLAATGTNLKICVFSGTGTNGVILIGDTRAGAACQTGDSYTVGKITGVALGTSRTFATSSYATTAAAAFTMTITFKGGNTSSFSGTSKFSGPNSTSPPTSSAPVSSSLGPVAVLCARAVVACQPTTTSLP